jgi:beta-glucosidase
MRTVEEQEEDAAFDMTCYRDGEGHVYDFGYGLNFEGVIEDERTKRYVK